MAFETLFCVIWLNPDKKLHPQARLLQSFCTNTPTPIPYCLSESDLESQANDAVANEEPESYTIKPPNLSTGSNTFTEINDADMSN